MNFIKKNKISILVFVAIVIAYIALRLYHILSLPMFTDEAIYTRWSQIAKQDSNWRFISLTDGKQPLFIWINILFMKFIHEPLLSGRLVSTVSGLLTLIGLFFVGKELFKNKWVGIIAAFLYVIFPFGLVYDRMALYDSLVATFTVWCLYVSILLVRRVRLDIAFILGLLAGGSALNKSNGYLNIYLLPITLLLFDWKKKVRNERLLHWCLYGSIAAALTYLYYSILRLSPFFHIIAEKDNTFIYPIREWIHHPFTYLSGNVSGLFSWFTNYMTWPVIIVVITAFFIDKKFLREKLLLIAWFVLPFMALALFGRVLYPRYILFMTVPLLVLASYTLVQGSKYIKNTYLLILCFFIVFSMQLYTDLKIETDFAHAPIPMSDLNQYVNDWPAGGGLNEAVQYFSNQANNQKIFIGTEGTFGLLPYGLEIYLIQNKNIILHGYWPIQDTPPIDALIATKTMPVYFVFYQPCTACSNQLDAPLRWHVKVVARFTKGIGNRYLTIYQLLP